MFIAALFRLCCFQLFFVLLAFFSSFPFSCPVFLFLFVITFDSSFSVFMSFLLSFLSVLLSCFCLVFCSVTFRRGPPPRGIVLVVDGFLVFWLIFSEGAVSGGVMCVCDRWLFSANHCIAVCFRICFRTVAAAPVHDLRAAPHCCDVDGVSGTSRRLAGACCLCVSGVLLQSNFDRSTSPHLSLLLISLIRGYLGSWVRLCQNIARSGQWFFSCSLGNFRGFGLQWYL